MDIFITLLSLGTNGYKELITQRKEVHQHLRKELGKVAAKYGERLLDIQNNPISIGNVNFKLYILQSPNKVLILAMTLTSLSVPNATETDTKKLSQLSSMMYMRHVTGCRVISSVEVKDVCGYKFDGLLMSLLINIEKLKSISNQICILLIFFRMGSTQVQLPLSLYYSRCLNRH